MKYGKQIKNILNQNRSNSTLVTVALLSGVAVGAALAVLFAPKKGVELRGDIAGVPAKAAGSLSELMDSIKAKFGTTAEGETVVDHYQNGAERPHANTKKPKSDIREIIHQAHISSDPALHQN
ncbi:YtxH domain-containing protein [Pedobacter sp. GR22-6]|uniref:YtxH domain-containing protein n=1 Tax=Pedobacter sp. GR22-6 TaxID=3127957 RepID=UPI00307E4527